LKLRILNILKAYKNAGKVSQRDILRRLGEKEEYVEPWLLTFERMGVIERKDEKTEKGQTTKVIYIKSDIDALTS
ncbi:MAG: hypothetical protein H3Z51_00375, partial [archaeon]|nr:hypothetical protein [archaeon]